MIDPWQTRASAFHPRLFHDLAALPETLRDAAAGALPAGDQFVAALYAPADYRSEGGDESEETPEHTLIFTDRSVIHVQAAPPDAAAPAPVCVALSDVLYVRTSHVLLYGRVQLFGACQGEVQSLDLRFNAVGWPMMDVEWRGLIGTVIGLPPLAAVDDRVVSEQENELLAPLPSKFAEGLRRYGLYTGEEVVSVLFQQEAWERGAMGQDRQIVPDTLLVLTNASMLILNEERGLVRMTEQFGLIITRIPLPALAGVQTITKEEGWEEIVFTLERAGASAERRLLLEPAKTQFWRGLWRGYKARE